MSINTPSVKQINLNIHWYKRFKSDFLFEDFCTEFEVSYNVWNNGLHYHKKIKLKLSKSLRSHAHFLYSFCCHLLSSNQIKTQNIVGNIWIRLAFPNRWLVESCVLGNSPPIGSQRIWRQGIYIHRYRTKLGKRGAAWPPFSLWGRGRKAEWWSSGPVLMGISLNWIIEGEYNLF